MSQRRYNWSFAELIDRISIVIQKIVYAESEEMRDEFVRERDDIIHDIDIYIKEGVVIDGKLLSYVCTLQLINATIWANESGARGEGGAKNYEFTHALNFDRSQTKMAISKRIKGRIDFKLSYSVGVWDLRL